jgi:hypothetical protein
MRRTGWRSAALRGLAGVCAAWALVGCQRTPEPPVVEGVDPGLVFNGNEVTVDVIGQNFFPSVEVSVLPKGESRVDPDFEVSLTLEQRTEGGPDGPATEQVELVDLELLSLQALRGTVPAGITPGVYRLDLRTPYGGEASLPGAVTVVDGRGAALQIELEQVSYRIYQQATLAVRLVDRLGEPVAQSWPVRLSLTADDGSAVSAAFEPGGLEDQRGVVSNGIVSLEGGLGVDGEAEISFTVATPTTLTLRVEEASETPRLASDDARMQWRPGEDLRVRVERLRDEDEVVAGAPFPVLLTLVDEYDNALEDFVETVVVEDACSSWAELVEIRGSAQLDALTREVTGTDRCALGQIIVNNGVLGASDTFNVVAGPVSRLEVDNNPLVVTAGEVFTAFVTPVDAYGNDAIWSGTLNPPQDSLGGVVGATCLGSSGVRNCTVRVIRAGSGVVVEFTGEPGLRGSSRPYRVDPAAADHVEVRVLDPVWVAGEPAAVDVRPVDAFGNVRDSGGLDPASVRFAVATGEVSCAGAGLSSDGWRRFSCTTTRAAEQVSLLVSTVDLLPITSSDPFLVINGPLAELQVHPASLTVAAGDALLIELIGMDAFGNVYTSQDDPGVVLTDVAGSMTPQEVMLGPDGRGAAAVVFTAAGTTSIRAEGADRVVGSSAPIVVTPAAADHVEVLVEAPWVWVNQATPISLEIVDAFGNRVPEDAEVEVRSANGAGTVVNLQVVNGTGSGNFRWSAASIADTLVATSTQPVGLAGASGVLVIVRGCGASGPAAVLTLPAGGQARYCVDPAAGDALVSASLAGSSARSGSLAVFGLSISGVGGRTGASAVQSLVVDRIGEHQLVGIAVQNDGCAAEASATVYVGLPGLPLGPFDIEAVTPALVVGGAPAATDLEISGVIDCDGLPAADADLRLRTDLGAIVGATPTGTGLRVTTDASGSAHAVLDASAVVSGGTATVRARSLDGLAGQEVEIGVVGDRQLPEVWWQVPRGGTADAVSAVELGFSEPLDPGTVSPAAVTITGPGVATVASVELLDGGDALAIVLAAPVLPSPGTPWRVRLSGTVQDLAGNPLDGGWSGTPADYVGAFGLSVPVDPVQTCSRSTEVFRPDGDDGAGLEADQVRLSFSAAVAPAWWVLTVEETGGTIVRLDYLVPIGAGDAWVWDGRDEAGKVLPPGLYTLSVDAEGNQGNRGGVCTRIVEIVQEGG